MITAPSLSTYVRALLLGTFCLCSVLNAASDEESGSCADDALDFGFYAFFDPVSYSADEDRESEGFHMHLGYEADLLSALEAMQGAGLSFNRQAIAVWDDIWLRSAGPQYDIVGGGITILDSRRRNAAGEELITFTSGHIIFRQSLMARAEDAERLDSYDKLNSDARIGSMAGTTGEARMLQLTGYADDDGVLIKGARFDTPKGSVIADGSEDYFITAAGESASLARRKRLHPPADTLPQVIYLGEETGEIELLEALAAGEVDALARGEVGNRRAIQVHGYDFVVTALDDQIEIGGFSLALEDEDLAACLDEKINWLTDDRRIGYGEWVEDPSVFMRRAQMWNERRAQED